MILLARLKRLASRVAELDNYCRRCGRKAEAFTVPDGLWRRATADSGPLCFRCFDRLADRGLGRAPVWRVTESP